MVQSSVVQPCSGTYKNDGQTVEGSAMYILRLRYLPVLSFTFAEPPQPPVPNETPPKEENMEVSPSGNVRICFVTVVRGASFLLFNLCGE